MIDVPASSYELETGEYSYVVEREMGCEVTVRCRHRDTGVTAEATGPSQYAARMAACSRVQEILKESGMSAAGSFRRVQREHAGVE